MANYTIQIQAKTDTSFTLLATRTGPMGGDKCGDFTYDNLGTKGLQNTGQAVTSCWR